MTRLAFLALGVCALLAVPARAQRQPDAPSPPAPLAMSPIADGGSGAAAGPRSQPPRANRGSHPLVTRGLLSYYGKRFAGRPTASGEPFDPDALTMAHNTLPFGTLVRVTNLRSRKSVVVRVNDRGPFGPRRIGDVSLAAARLLGMIRAGIVEAKFEVLGHRGQSSQDGGK